MLELEHIHGYRGSDCVQNLWLSADGKLVYSAASVGIVLCPDKNQQRFFLAHTDDVLCVALDAARDTAATGEKGRAQFFANLKEMLEP